MREFEPVTYKSTSKSDASEFTTRSHPSISCTSSRNKYVFPSVDRRDFSWSYMSFAVKSTYSIES